MTACVVRGGAEAVSVKDDALSGHFACMHRRIAYCAYAARAPAQRTKADARLNGNLFLSENHISPRAYGARCGLQIYAQANLQ